MTEIRLALRAGDVEQARRLLAEWRGSDGRPSVLLGGRPPGDRGSCSARRIAISLACWSASCCCLAPAEQSSIVPALSWPKRGESATTKNMATSEAFARQTFAIIDWLPVRLTAAGFAVVGDFEDAVYCWRTQADRWPGDGLGIVLASGAGALGVRLGMPECRKPAAASIEWRSAPATKQMLISWRVPSGWYGVRWCCGACCCCCWGLPVW
jgi:adenosylcobinamide-phosphate synthase